MTEKIIIKQLALWVDDRQYPFQIPNAFFYGWECDYWALDIAGVAREFEIKISRSDFFNDAKKQKHAECKGANYFYYVVPKDLIKPSEVDKRYGLIYVWDGGHVSVEKKPRRLHDKKFEQWQMLANKMYFRWRTMWKQKYVDKEITFDEYRAGFALELKQEELI
jgi:hypothetical protein